MIAGTGGRLIEMPHSSSVLTAAAADEREERFVVEMPRRDERAMLAPNRTIVGGMTIPEIVYLSVVMVDVTPMPAWLAEIAELQNVALASCVLAKFSYVRKPVARCMVTTFNDNNGAAEWHTLHSKVVACWKAAASTK